VLPLPMPAAANSTRKAASRPPKRPASPAAASPGRQASATSAPSAITTKLHSVTRAPPKRSASQPPSGRASAPTSGPIHAVRSASTVGNWFVTSNGKAADKPTKLPKVPRYSQHISQLWRRLKITACSAKPALASARSFIQHQQPSALATTSGTHTKPAFCSHIGPCAVVCGAPPAAPNRPTPITAGTTNCTTVTPRLPRPAFMPSA